MLIEFRVANFRSFKEPATLSLVATKDDSLPDNLIVSPPGFAGNLLKSAAVFGANASGKSNLIKALAFMRDCVVNSAAAWKPGQSIPVQPFKLDATSATSPSSFELAFLRNGEQHVYGFSLTAQRVEREWLYIYPPETMRKNLVFERGAPSEGKLEVVFGKRWTGERKSVQQQTRPNALLLSTAAQLNHELAGALYEWFAGACACVTDVAAFCREIGEEYTVKKAHSDAAFRKDVLRLLQEADMGIADIRVRKTSVLEDPKFRGLPKFVQKDILGNLPEDAYTLQPEIWHDGVDDELNAIRVPMAMDEESTGTKHLFSMSGPLRDALQRGMLLCMDEFDSGLHPMLTRAVLRMFHDPAVNTRNSQFVCSTHDVGLLDFEVFRRDQVWFTEKDQGGGSELFALSELKGVRKSEINLRTQYLQGRFGAVPILGAFRLEQAPASEVTAEERHGAAE